MKKRDRILKLLAIANRGLTGAEIHRIVGGFWLPYYILMSLELAGKIYSEWVDEPYPRHRVYFFKPYAKL